MGQLSSLFNCSSRNLFAAAVLFLGVSEEKDSSSTKVDHAIYLSLWQWAKRRHPNKPRRWIKDKYFHSMGNRKWVFCGEIADKKGNFRQIQLFYAHRRVPIKRHIKTKGDANPYDLAWELYFEKRLDVRYGKQP